MLEGPLPSPSPNILIVGNILVAHLARHGACLINYCKNN